MTLHDLQTALLNCDTLEDCDSFLQLNLHEIRPIFYGLTQSEMDQRRFDFEDAFYAFTNSSVGALIRAGESPSASVLALLVFFLSLFERTRFHTALYAVCELLPPGSLKNRVNAIFLYRDITDSATDYSSRFDRILGLLLPTWANGSEEDRNQCESLVREYAIEALLETVDSGTDARTAIELRFLDQDIQERYPILRNTQIEGIFRLNSDELNRARVATRTRIVESFHDEACRLVPDALLVQVSDDFQGDELPAIQSFSELPKFLDDKLRQMGAFNQPQRQGARQNFDADHERNLMYLGTYFPKTMIESWNVFHELLQIPFIYATFAQKDVIRILDIGSGTGAAILGLLQALSQFEAMEADVEITSIDYNLDALEKQSEIINVCQDNMSYRITHTVQQIQFPFNLDGLNNMLSDYSENSRSCYDIVTCWKCLCEFYNHNYAEAQGIIKHTINNISKMLVPLGICVIADVTTTDNNYEYFAMTLNREWNQYDSMDNSRIRTILPVSCAKNSLQCCNRRCYTQRKFKVRHSLNMFDETKIAYRVFAPLTLADYVLSTYIDSNAYKVNAARPDEACVGGIKSSGYQNAPCGFTGFFQGRD